MGLLPLIEKGGHPPVNASLPLFYMNDFSRLGLIVPRLSQARALLESEGFSVVDSPWGKAARLDGDEKQLDSLLDLLHRHRIEYDLGDLVSCIYQG